MIKVRMFPHLSELGNNESGIHTVVRKYFEHLPEFGIELVDPGATSYDLRASHAGITGGDTEVCHCHGLYWSGDFPCDDWEWHVNSRVIEAIRSAKEITVPSEWVNETLKRELRKPAHVIPHGIDWDEWQHKEDNQGYVLWAKNRAGSDVVENSILDILVQRFPDVQFVSTFMTPSLRGLPYSSGMWPKNFKIIETGGKTPHAEMRRFIQRAGVHLSTTKETFGLAVLESLASGTPVLGWDFGGNSFLVQHGVSGYLARPGDVDDLCEGLVYCLKHRKVLGANGRELAKAWTWAKACEMVAGVYRLAMEEQPETVGVVIPVYNKPVEQVERAINSCLTQTSQPEKIILVNDGSEMSYNRLADLSDKIQIINQPNSGVAAARNNGIAHTSSKYITCLDSDDWLDPTFLEVCIRELESNRSLGIAYTGLRAHNADGSNVISQWPGQFDADKQLTYAKKQNQVPTACVFRRDAWERVGGYKSRYCPDGAGSEDAAFWSAICSIGYSAKKVTDEALFNYSAEGGFVHGNREYSEVDWLSMYPWAKDGLHPFASVATPKHWSHPVRQYDQPAISVIIPVGPGHEKEVANALDSLEMQTFRKWEAVVVWDNGPACVEDMHRLEKAYPYVGSIITNKAGTGCRNGCAGAGTARNMGASIARAPLLFYLDADDVLADPAALDKMLKAWNQQEAIIYGDYLGKAVWDYEAAQKEFGDRLLHYHRKSQQAVFSSRAADYDPALAQRQPELNRASPNMPYYHWCLVSVLIPKAWHDAIGGFDEAMETWEDVDYHWRLARAGYCFYRVPEPLVMYAYHKGHRREKSAVSDEASLQQHKAMIQYIRQKEAYQREAVVCNCGKRQQPTVSGSIQASGMSDGDFVMIEFSFLGSDRRENYGAPLISPTGQMVDGKKLDYKGYSRRKGDRFLVHVKDQQARPDMFRLVPNEIKAPEGPKVELAEPVLLVAEKKRGRIKAAA